MRAPVPSKVLSSVLAGRATGRQIRTTSREPERHSVVRRADQSRVESSRLDTIRVVKITASACREAQCSGAQQTIHAERNGGHDRERAGALAQVRFLDDSEPFAMQGVCGDLAVIDHQRDRVMAILHPDQRVGLHQIDFGAEQGGANSE